MKEKILGTYKRMQEMLKEKNYKMITLKEKTFYKWNENEWELEKGTTVYDCDKETFAKIMFTNGKVNVAYLKGVITWQDLEKVAREVYEN